MRESNLEDLVEDLPEGKIFEVHCFTRHNYERLGNQFPENSYVFVTEDEVLECLTNLVKNKVSGIWKTELIINTFK